MTPQPPEFRELFEAEFGYVARALRYLGVRPPDTEDVAHDVFLHVFRQLHAFDSARPLRPWLFGFAYRIARDFRALARHKYEAVCEPADAPDPAPTGDELLVRSEALALALRALDTLDDDERAVFVAHELDELPMPEVAEALGIALNTAYSRLRRARRNFEAAAERVATRESCTERTLEPAIVFSGWCVAQRSSRPWPRASAQGSRTSAPRRFFVGSYTHAGLGFARYLRKRHYRRQVCTGSQERDAEQSCARSLVGAGVCRGYAQRRTRGSGAHAPRCNTHQQPRSPRAQPSVALPAQPEPSKEPSLSPESLERVLEKRAAPGAPAVSAEPATSLAAERRLLDQARQALARGEPAAGLAPLEVHGKQFPKGVLTEEREALAVRLLAALGNQAAALARADNFHRRFPQSLFTPAVDNAIAPFSRRNDVDESKP